MTSSSGRVRATAYAVLLVYSLALAAYGVNVPSTLTRLLSVLPIAIIGAFALFDSYLWRTGPFVLLVRHPVVRGTWHGTLTSYRRDATDSRISTQHEAVLAIRQTLTTVAVTLMTSESISRSSAGQITKKQDGEFVIQYHYLNEPKLPYRIKGSDIHPGSAAAVVGGLRPSEMNGEYWTARESQGTFAFRYASDQIANSFEVGVRLARTPEGQF